MNSRNFNGKIQLTLNFRSQYLEVEPKLLMILKRRNNIIHQLNIKHIFLHFYLFLMAFYSRAKMILAFLLRSATKSPKAQRPMTIEVIIIAV